MLVGCLPQKNPRLGAEEAGNPQIPTGTDKNKTKQTLNQSLLCLDREQGMGHPSETENF